MRVVTRKPWGRILLAASLCACAAYVFLIHDFLAISGPVAGQVLVVEGWFPDRPAMQEARVLFSRQKYQLVLCVGGPAPVPPGMAPLSYAELAASRLVALGLDPKSVHAVIVPATKGGRTFACAVAAREWLVRERPDVQAVDVFTLGVHARKSQILFRKAFPPRFAVGVIAATETAYDPDRWWASREGWYIVLRNTAGYFQALAQPPRTS